MIGTGGLRDLSAASSNMARKKPCLDCLATLLKTRLCGPYAVQAARKFWGVAREVTDCSDA
jgi:hypothetical protein